MPALIQALFQGTDPQVVAAMIALIGVVVSIVVSAVISLIVARRSSYINAVTAERSKWIDKLRENIADLLGTCGALYRGEKQDRQKADRLIAVITMQLNPKGDIDKNIIDLLALFLEKAEKKCGNYKTMEKATVRHAQFLLKAEWKQVKLEAMGFWSKPRWYWKACTRGQHYRNFCREPERLANAFK